MPFNKIVDTLPDYFSPALDNPEISLDEPKPQDLIALQDSNKPNLSETALNRRTEVAHVAYGPAESPGKDTLKQSFVNGDEPAIRQTLDSRAAIAFDQAKRRYFEEWAKKKDHPITNADLEKLRQLKQVEFLSDPDTALERSFAKGFVQQQAQERPKVGEQLAKVSDELKTSTALEDLIAWRQVLKGFNEDLDTKAKDQGWLSWGQEIGQSLIPFWSSSNFIDAVPNARTSTYLPGKNVREQAEYLALQPLPQRQKLLKAAIDQISKSSLMDAQVFLHAMESYSHTDAVIDNVVLGALDTWAVAPVAKGVGQFAVRKASDVGKLRSTLKSVAKSSTARTPEDAVAMVGDIEASAEMKAYKQARANFEAQDPLGDSQALFDQIPNIADPTRIGSDIGSLSQGRANQLVSQITGMVARGLTALANPQRQVRLDEQAYKKAFQEAKEELAARHPSLTDSILDVQFHAPSDNLANVGVVEFKVGPNADKATQRKSTKASRDAEWDAAAPKASEAVQVPLPKVEGGPKATLEATSKKASEATQRVFKVTPEEEMALRLGDQKPLKTYQDFYDYVEQFHLFPESPKGGFEELKRVAYKHNAENPLSNEELVHSVLNEWDNVSGTTRKQFDDYIRRLNPKAAKNEADVEHLLSVASDSPGHFADLLHAWQKGGSNAVEKRAWEHQGAFREVLEGVKLPRVTDKKGLSQVDQAARAPITPGTPKADVMRMLGEDPEKKARPWGMDWNPRYIKDKEIRQLFDDLGKTLWQKKGTPRTPSSREATFDKTAFYDELGGGKGLLPEPDLVNEPVLSGKKAAKLASKEPKVDYEAIIPDIKVISNNKKFLLSKDPTSRSEATLKMFREAIDALPEEVRNQLEHNDTYHRFLELEGKTSQGWKKPPKDQRPVQKKTKANDLTKASEPPLHIPVTDTEIRSILQNIPDLIPNKVDAEKYAREVLKLPTWKQADALLKVVKERIQVAKVLAMRSNGDVMPEYFKWQANQGYKKAQELHDRVQKMKRLDKEVPNKKGVLKEPEQASYDASNPIEAETRVGNLQAGLFESEAQARYYADQVYKLGDAYSVKPQGTGYYVSITKAVDETLPSVRDLLITPKTTSKHGFFDNWLGALRTPDEKVSELATENRKVAVNAPKALYKHIRPIAEEIGKLNNRWAGVKKQLGLGDTEFGELERILEKNRDFYDPETKLRGQYYRTIGELERAWLAEFNKVPTEQQTKAYFATTILNDVDYVQRNLNYATQVSRLGVEKIKPHISIKGEDGTIQKLNLGAFPGRVRDSIPWKNPEDAGILIVDHNTSNARYYDKSQVTRDVRREIEAKVKNQGYKIIEVAQPTERPLKGIGHDSEIINHLVVRDFEAGRFDWLNYPYRPGGHVIYNDRYFVKQPIIRRKDTTTEKGRYSSFGHYYEGDVSLLNVADHKTAVRMSEDLEKARQLYVAKAEQALKDHLESRTPYSLEDWKAFFEGRELPDGSKTPAILSPDHPITWTESGRNVPDMDHYKGVLQRNYPNFTNTTRSGYNISALLDKKFYGQRDPNLPRLEKYGTEQNPLFRLNDPRLAKPLDAMNSGVANAIRTRYMGDYKASAAEHFIQEFADVMQPEYTLERMRSNPLYYLHNPPLDTETSNKARLAMARQVRMRTLNFLGTHTELKTQVDYVQRKLIDTIYSVGGQKKGDWVSDHLLPSTTDPFTYARSAAFHLNLGLFNPVQFIVQGMAAVHAVAIAGVGHGIPGMGKAMLMQALRHTENPKILEHYAGIASRLGLDPEDFKTSFKLLQETGFDHIGRETSWRNDVQDPKLYQGAFGKFLSWGAIPFNTGESFGRLTAWNTAFSEWRAANPGKAIGTLERNQILNRADLLSGNMTRASHATFEHGIMSIPTQYWAWKLRMMEQVLGTRLTGVEKARMLATYSVLFGLPVGLNTALPIWPMYSEAHQAAMRNNIKTDPRAIHLLMEGAFESAVKELVGKDYNIPTRYGPDGMPIFRDVIMGDKGIFDLLQGASGSTLGSLFKTANPLFRYATSMFDDTWKPNIEDFVEASRGISGANNMLRAYYALNTGRYISRNHTLVTDTLTNTDAVLMAFGGLLPQELGDTGDLIRYLKNQKGERNALNQQFALMFRRGLEAFASGNQTFGEQYMRRAKAVLEGGGVPPHEQAALVHKVFSEHRTLYDRLQQQRMKTDPQWWLEGSLAKKVQALDESNPASSSEPSN